MKETVCLHPSIKCWTKVVTKLVGVYDDVSAWLESFAIKGIQIECLGSASHHLNSHLWAKLNIFYNTHKKGRSWRRVNFNLLAMVAATSSNEFLWKQFWQRSEAKRILIHPRLHSLGELFVDCSIFHQLCIAPSHTRSTNVYNILFLWSRKRSAIYLPLARSRKSSLYTQYQIISTHLMSFLLSLELLIFYGLRFNLERFTSRKREAKAQDIQQRSENEIYFLSSASIIPPLPFNKA